MGNWEQRAIPVLKWAAIPIAVFGFGFFVIGPWLSGGHSGTAVRGATTTAKVNQQPIEKGERKWTPVSPPQVNVSVTRKVVEEDPIPPIEGEPPPIEPPDDDGTVDEAGVGGLKPPVATGASTTSTGGEGGTTATAFKGIGSGRH